MVTIFETDKINRPICAIQQSEFWKTGADYKLIKFNCLDFRYIERDCWEDFVSAYKDTTLEPNAVCLNIAQTGRIQHNREVDNPEAESDGEGAGDEDLSN